MRRIFSFSWAVGLTASLGSGLGCARPSCLEARVRQAGRAVKTAKMLRVLTSIFSRFVSLFVYKCISPFTLNAIYTRRDKKRTQAGNSGPSRSLCFARMERNEKKFGREKQKVDWRSRCRRQKDMSTQRPHRNAMQCRIIRAAAVEDREWSGAATHLRWLFLAQTNERP